MKEVPNFEFDVALSFAGEDRIRAKALADLLLMQGVSVFFDEYQQSVLWGKDLYQHLASIYCNSAQYCIVFVSIAYARKLWTRHELKQAQARAFQENREYILPLRIDDTELPGLNTTVGYIDLRQITLDRVATIVVEKLSKTAEWATWPETPTEIKEFSPQLKTGVDAVVASACTVLAKQVKYLRTEDYALSQLLSEMFRSVAIEQGRDIELTCLDATGLFIYHPWQGLVGKNLSSVWAWRPGFADWAINKISHLRRGYLTWKDPFASDPILEVELALKNYSYVRRTILGFRCIPINPSVFWAIAVEGHEIANLGPSKLFATGDSA